MKDLPSKQEHSDDSVARAGDGAPLVRALATANPRNFPVLARQLIHRWGKALGGETVFEPSDTPHIQFRTLITGLYLRGLQDSYSIILPPYLDPSLITLSALFSNSTLESSVFVLCSSKEQSKVVDALLPKGRAFVLSPEEIEQVFLGDTRRNRDALRRVVTTKADSLRRLHTFDTKHPAYGEMFFGRRPELELLVYEERDSFLITGPSKIGKTSLLFHYRWHLKRTGDPRLGRSIYIDLQSCARKSEDEAARYFAMHFRDVPYTSQDLKINEMQNFLYSVLDRMGGPFEIILDEADGVCHTQLLITIAQFASSSRSRLIVTGRGALRRFWRKNQATALGRLRDLRFQALNPDEAWQLFSRPIEALGLRIDSPDIVRESILQQTSRMPHLVQGYARSLIGLPSLPTVGVITPMMMGRGQDSFVGFGILRTHLEDLQSDLARIAAVEVLTDFRTGLYTPERIQHVLRRHGCALSIGEVMDLCDDLVMNCLLTWEHTDSYGPPRWDICEVAQRQREYLTSLRRECLDRVMAGDK